MDHPVTELTREVLAMNNPMDTTIDTTIASSTEISMIDVARGDALLVGTR